MAQLTKQALIVENNQSFPNNNTGAITPTILRNFNTDMIDSTVNQQTYNTASAVVDSRLDNLENFTGSALVTASVDFATITFTKGDGSTFDLAVTASVASVDWDNISDKPSGLVSGSSQVSAITGSSLITASFDNGTRNLTFTKGDSTTFNVNIPDVSGSTGNFVTTSSFNAYTQSVDTKFSTIGTQSGSWDNTNLNAFSASQITKDSTLATYTGSIDTKFTTLGTQSGSWVTESETGSFARTNVTNTFTATQNITGDLNVTGIITANEIHTIIESSSVIFSSGSNILGDAINDTQTLNGTVRVSGSQQVTGSLGITGNITLINGNAVSASHFHALGTNGITFEANGGTDVALFGAGGGNGATFYGQVNANAVSASSITGLGSPADFSQSVDSRLDESESSASLFATKFATIGTQSGSWGGGSINTGSFATTGSNTFDGGQTILNGGIDLQSNPQGSGSAYVSVTGRVDTTSDPTNVYSALQLVKPGSGDNLIGLAVNSYSAQYGTATPMILADGNNPDGNNTAIGFPSNGQMDVWKKSNFKYGVSVTGSTELQSFTASLQQGYAYVGGANGKTTTVPTSSFAGGGTINTGSFITTGSSTANQAISGALSLNTTFTTNLPLQAQDNGTNVVPISYGDVFGTYGTEFGYWLGTNFSGVTVSGTGIVNGTITGTNFGSNFEVNIVNGTITNGSTYTFTGPALQTLSVTGSVVANGRIAISAANGNTVSMNQDAVGVANSNGQSFNATPGAFQLIDNNNGNRVLTFAATSSVMFNGGGTWQGGPQIAVYDDSVGDVSVIGFQTNENYTDGRVTILTPLITQQAVQITGSLSVSGSINTSVIPLAISSNTASLNASNGTTFQLNLVSGSATRLEVSGTKSGQTLNILVSQSASGPGTLVLGGNIVEPSGSFYSASQVASAEDILTLATFVNANKVYVANVKNFI
jgi:hypothetical protein